MVVSNEKKAEVNKLLGLDFTYSVFYYLLSDVTGSFKKQVQITYENAIVFVEAEILVSEGLEVILSFGYEPVDPDVVQSEFEIKSVVGAIKSESWDILAHENTSVSSNKASSEKLILKHPSINISNTSIIVGFKVADPDKVDIETCSSLSRDLAILLKEENFSDITINCSGQLFSVHRSILAARLPRLTDMIRCETIVEKDGTICINDMSQETMTLLLRYLYSNKVEELTVEKAEDLLAASHKYGALELKEICSKFLHKNLDLFNILHTLQFAELQEDKNLKNAALQLFSRCYCILKQTEYWTNFTKENAVFADEILRLSVRKRKI